MKEGISSTISKRETFGLVILVCFRHVAHEMQYFPSGVPHSLQGLGANGTEFLLIFDDGHFSEESTFILTDWLGKTSASLGI